MVWKPERGDVEVREVRCRERAAEAARTALAKARRVVIVTKCRYMGDTLVATPFFGQLRGHLPDAEITLITAPTAAVALENCPHLTRVLPIPMRGVGRWRYSKELLGTLRAGQYDAAFILDRSLRCAVICAVAGVPVRVGYANECRRPFLTAPIPYFFDRHEVDCHLDMLRAIGLTATDALPDLWITEAERTHAEAILREQGWSGERPLFGLQPGANDPHIREWGAERYARVADTLLAEKGGSAIIMGGGAERKTAERLVAAMRSPVINLAGRLELREALATIGLCDLWVGNDTGLLHAAVAQRVPSVGLFGPNKVTRWGYDTPSHRSLVVFPETPALDDAAVRRAMDAITEEMVLNATRSVLQHVDDATVSASYALRVVPGVSPYFRARLRPAVSAPVRRR